MHWNDQFASITGELAAGKPTARVSVKEFLSWFNAQRRGYGIVRRIRSALRKSGLTTEPDFESAFIDSEIAFRLSADVSSAKLTSTPVIAPTSGSLTISAGSTTVAAPQSDPTYRISKLKAANTKPVSIAPTASLGEAVTIMLTNHFSQLPVMIGERDVKGVISWQSVGTRLSLGKGTPFVKDLMDSAQEIRAESSLFQAIPIIVEHQYVLVRGAENRITGILTSSDLNIQFQQLAEPFLQLGEIENQIRQIIGEKLSPAELAEARDPSDQGRVVETVSDLSFGEYIRLVENTQRWTKLGLPIDRKTFCSKLENVRLIRNDVMHFDPDGIPPEDLDDLRDFARFLQRLQSIGIT
jgi:CBS domain-containing protein